MSDVVEIPVGVWEHCQRDAETIAFLHRENARLKAEVKGLTEERCFLNEKLNYFVNQTVKNREQVERLRKAGDALYESEIGYYGEQILDDMKHHSGELCRNWNAAKEGKPTK